MMEMVSSPARKLEAAMARFVLRGVFPKKEIAGGLDDPPVAETDAMVFIQSVVLRRVGLPQNKDTTSVKSTYVHASSLLLSPFISLSRDIICRSI